LLFLNNNLHAVHHRYPTLPWFELPKRYRTDRERNLFAEVPPPLRGYRTVARSWLWRPIDVPVAGHSSHERAETLPLQALRVNRPSRATKILPAAGEVR
jgi:fatty acid desaturase